MEGGWLSHVSGLYYLPHDNGKDFFSHPVSMGLSGACLLCLLSKHWVLGAAKAQDLNWSVLLLLLALKNLKVPG